MLFLHDQIGVLENFATPKFLADCAPQQVAVSYEHANTPRQGVPIHTGTLQHDPTVFLLTSTNSNTKQHWTETFHDLRRIGLTVVPVLGIDGAKEQCMKAVLAASANGMGV